MESVVFEGKKTDNKQFCKKVPLDSIVLDLRHQSIKQIDLSPLGMLKQLEILYLDNNQLVSLDLSPLAQCKKLCELSLSFNSLTSIDLSPLVNCQALQKINLEYNILTEINLEPLSKCPNLQNLNINKNRLTELDLSPLLNCKKLRCLDIGAHIYEPTTLKIDMDILTQLSQLEELSISSLQAEEINLGFLENYSYLKKFVLRGMRIVPELLHPLSKCLQLQYLDISFNFGATTLDLSPLANFSKLQKLILCENGFTELNLTPLAQCINLEFINLTDNKLTELDVTPLIKCTQLSKLWIDSDVKLIIDKQLTKDTPLPPALRTRFSFFGKLKSSIKDVTQLFLTLLLVVIGLSVAYFIYIAITRNY